MAPSTWRAPDGVRIAYEVVGEGPAVLLLHGFAANRHVNWERPGVVGNLTDAGFTVVSYDARGHGQSDKPHDPDAYGRGRMVDDARGLVDHLGLEHFDAVGYSMGAQTAAWWAPSEPRLGRLVLGGIGDNLLLPPPVAEQRYPALAIAEGLEADDPDTVTRPTPRAFRAFADATKADRLALAALQRSRVVTEGPDLSAIAVPVLLVAGEEDTLIGDVEPVAQVLYDARIVVVPGNHLSAVVSPAFATALVRFLAGD